MTFLEAYKEMVKGKKVERQSLPGQWYFIDPATSKVTIHLNSGKNIKYGQLDTMAKNCLAEDWVVVEETKK